MSTRNADFTREALFEMAERKRNARFRTEPGAQIDGLSDSGYSQPAGDTLLRFRAGVVRADIHQTRQSIVKPITRLQFYASALLFLWYNIVINKLRKENGTFLSLATCRRPVRKEIFRKDPFGDLLRKENGTFLSLAP